MSQTTTDQPTVKVSHTDTYHEGYANSVQVRMSVWDFFLVFGTMSQETAEEVQVKNFQGIYLSPRNNLPNADIPLWLLFPLFFVVIFLSHWTLLRLPYFWDEAGYYIPAALDFYRHGWLIPHFTNAHPPLPNIFLGTLWHITGYNILSTRLLVCAFAAAGLLAVFRLAQNL